MSTQSYSDSLGSSLRSQDLSNFPIHLWNESGQFSPHSTEEIVAGRNNRFEGWRCTAGINSLYINFDGDITRGVCKVGGKFGNIYVDPKFPKTDVICNKTFCMCGSDMMAPKFKGDFTQADLKHSGPPASPRVTEPIALTGSDWLIGEPNIKRVSWGLGRRCNYDCSYCSPAVHSATEKFKSKEQILAAARVIVEQFCRGTKTEFFIAGGEPTLQPGILELVQYLHSEGHTSVVISNGSHKPEMYATLIQYSHLCVSAHFDFLRPEKFVSNVRAAATVLLERHGTKRQLYNRLDVKLNTLPGRFAESEALARQVLSIEGFHLIGSLRFNPLFRPEATDELYAYTARELKLFEEINIDSRQWSKLRGNALLKVWRSIQAGHLQQARPEILKIIYLEVVRLKNQIRKAPADSRLLIRNLINSYPGFAKRMHLTVYAVRHPIAVVRGLYFDLLDRHPQLRKCIYFTAYVVSNWRTVVPKGLKRLGLGS